MPIGDLDLAPVRRGSDCYSLQARSFHARTAVSRVRVSIHIARPRREVYEFAATPRKWSLWHPGLLAVSGVVDRPPEPGERVIERVSVAGRQTRIAWEVTAHDAPERWAMVARIPQRGEAAFEFRLARNGRGTLCECEIAYDGVNRLVDILYVRPRVAAEAKRSLVRLKQALEPAPGKRRAK